MIAARPTGPLYLGVRAATAQQAGAVFLSGHAVPIGAALADGTVRVQFELTEDQAIDVLTQLPVMIRGARERR